jgi:hypothetical protein
LNQSKKEEENKAKFEVERENKAKEEQEQL